MHLSVVSVDNPVLWNDGLAVQAALLNRQRYAFHCGKIIIITNIQGWAIWPVPSPELQFSPSFLWSPNCSLSLWAVKV